MKSLKYEQDLGAGIRVFHIKYADNALKTIHIVWFGSMEASMREETGVCSWLVKGSIKRSGRVVDEKNGTSEVPEVAGESHIFKVENSHSGQFNECAARYETDLENGRKTVNDKLQITITSDVPLVKRVIKGLPNVVEVTELGFVAAQRSATKTT